MTWNMHKIAYGTFTCIIQVDLKFVKTFEKTKI